MKFIHEYLCPLNQWSSSMIIFVHWINEVHPWLSLSIESMKFIHDYLWPLNQWNSSIIIFVHWVNVAKRDFLCDFKHCDCAKSPIFVPFCVICVFYDLPLFLSLRFCSTLKCSRQDHPFGSRSFLPWNSIVQGSDINIYHVMQ